MNIVQLNKYNNEHYQSGSTLKKLLWYFINMFFFKTLLPFPSSMKVFLFFKLVCILSFLGSSKVVGQSILPYEMYSNHFDVEKYFKDPAASRKYDEEGIITQKNEYHALTISVFGTMCIDKFLKTGDSVYYIHADNQMKYFKDSSRLLFFDNNSAVGLPYHMTYHGLKPPWFSGLAQGMAASFLFRHYQLTNDSYSLNLAKKIIRQMLKNEKDGGAMSKTREGYTWIEEYPNYNGSKGVLNGFINGIIGLKDYIEYFPEDTNAVRIHDECYDAMFSTLESYDKPNWTSYNRNGSSIRNSYIRLQIQQFDQLYHIYNDNRFRQQMHLWSKFAYKKHDKEWSFYNDPMYQFSVKMNFIDSVYVFSDNENFQSSLVDVPVSEHLRKKIIEIDLRKDDCYYIELPTWIKKSNIKRVFINKKVVDVDSLVFDRGTLKIMSDISIFDVKLKLKRKVKEGDAEMDCKIYNYKNYLLPMFAFVPIKEKKNLLKGQVYTVEFDSENTINARMYYRFSSTSKGLRTVKYSIARSFLAEDKSFTAPSDGYYEFFLSYDVKLPESKFVSFNLE